MLYILLFIFRTQGRARGIDSDEVRIMQKVLAKEASFNFILFVLFCSCGICLYFVM